MEKEPEIEKGAIISEDEKYRYQLWRIWDKTKPLVLFIMLNPSTADADNDDPTIKRLIGFAKSWGYGGFYVGNLFAYRSTDPKGLLSQSDPVGWVNGHHLLNMQFKCELIVCAWGNRPILNKLKQTVFDSTILNKKLHCIDLSNDGTPKHPLYLKGDLQPKPYYPKRKKRVHSSF